MNLNFNFTGFTLLRDWWKTVKSNFQTIQTEFNQEVTNRKNADSTHRLATILDHPDKSVTRAKLSEEVQNQLTRLVQKDTDLQEQINNISVGGESGEGMQHINLSEQYNLAYDRPTSQGITPYRFFMLTNDTDEDFSIFQDYDDRGLVLSEPLAVGEKRVCIITKLTVGGADPENGYVYVVPDEKVSSGGGSITVDSTLSPTSTNPVQNKVVKAALDTLETQIGNGGVTVDSALSSTSTNPVQNKVINSALNGKASASHTHTKSQITDLAIDSTLSSTSTNPVQNKVIKTALDTLESKIGTGSGGIADNVLLLSELTRLSSFEYVGDGLTLRLSDCPQRDTIYSFSNTSDSAHIVDTFRYADETYTVRSIVDNIPGIEVGDIVTLQFTTDMIPEGQYIAYVLSRTDNSGGGSVTVDSALSSTSTNPVQNKVITSALNGKASASHTHTKSQITDLTIDSALSSTSTNPVQNKVIKSALDTLQSQIGSGGSSGSGSGGVKFATCSTASNVASKVASTANGDFTLTDGAIVFVIFDPYDAVNGHHTLNIDGTGAKSIMVNAVPDPTEYPLNYFQGFVYSASADAYITLCQNYSFEQDVQMFSSNGYVGIDEVTNVLNELVSRVEALES